MLQVWRLVVVVCVVSLSPCLHGGKARAQCLVTAPASLRPVEGLVVTNPPSFSWVPGQNNTTIYFNVSTSPDMDQLIDVINWVDDGQHRYIGETDRFLARDGQTFYWRVVATGCNPLQVAVSPVQSFVVGDFSQDPYYFVININWGMGAYPYGWDPALPETIQTEDLLDLINNRVQTRGINNDKKLAFCFMIPYTMIPDPLGYVPTLHKLFQVSEEANLPVMIGLDGFEWFRGRQDLWNWWNPDLSGYDVNNRTNVEWTDWSQDSAVQFGWRNWGSAFKLREPHPNISSPAVITANQHALQVLGAIILDWYNGLPPEKKFLFAGIQLGWEVSIGINYFYPKDELGCSNNPTTCTPFSNAIQVGYAAVYTAGLGSSGSLTSLQLTNALQIYMNALAQSLYDIGVPRRKIFLHIGADDNPSAHPTMLFARTDAALTPFAHPGFSFYTYGNGPGGLLGLENTLSQILETYWSVSEWGGPGDSPWIDVINQFYIYHNNKFINAFLTVDNSAVRQKLGEVSCWIHPPVVQSHVSVRQATLSWSTPSQAEQVYLNLTSKPKPSINGGFAVVDGPNINVTGQNSYTLDSLSDGTYYWKLFADGCGRRVISDMGTFVIGNAEPDGGQADGQEGAFDHEQEDGFSGQEDSSSIADSQIVTDGFERDSLSGGCGCQAMNAEPTSWIGILFLGLWILLRFTQGLDLRIGGRF